jgi:hypothetical protein
MKSRFSVRKQGRLSSLKAVTRLQRTLAGDSYGHVSPV